MSKQFIVLKDGKIAYQVYGQGQHTLLLFHGLLGSSWLGDEWIQAIEQAGVRCIVLERPGYGDSSIFSIECVADWNIIFAQLIHALNIQSAIAIGCSAGAVYAYATAFAFPDIITHVWVLDGVPAVFLETVIRHYSHDDQATYNRFLVSPIAEIQDDYATWLEAFSEQQSDHPYMLNILKDARANHHIGMARESQLQIRPWGFDISAIQQPVTLWHAEHDAMVPYNAAQEMTQVLANSTLITAQDLDISSEQTIHSESISQGFLHLVEQLQDYRGAD
ncbi:alpha/beta fold hydrolase [Leptothoe sp. LEGE 181152]|uniref:Alpha/beta fold hydrolase n=1 Tax=Adonisia turfae CCMR0081 TaxID=2292702 RepID=A0A6M0RKX8_9CYAN|nr:alpha/beta fold hydrolase [Adonisia turfae]MDV3349000.1 alpha/beta fold hydrolase [Leptothoe sp. LEGE 181152]NEZ56904.1 alpha/beta fold hydrolase [Adonisia turfae CCMR0081]